MKKIKLFLYCAVVVGGLCSSALAPKEIGLTDSEGPYVFICTGPSATRYHSASDCRGLGACGGSVIKVVKSKAMNEGRTPCKICCK